ncbi:unnamed protein product [Sphagnum jensenii]|uniref:AB hydrolase-1 domain-containing protein n=1 Tax=Sphagnum jensenii TaxID=128206 RepID=A0ABP0VF05_9BRYO
MTDYHWSDNGNDGDAGSGEGFIYDDDDDLWGDTEKYDEDAQKRVHAILGPQGEQSPAFIDYDDAFGNTGNYEPQDAQSALEILRQFREQPMELYDQNGNLPALLKFILHCLQPILFYAPLSSSPGNWKFGRRYPSRNPETKKTVLFFHGNGGNAEIWSLSVLRMQSLVDATYYIFEYPGYGANFGESINKDELIKRATSALFDLYDPESRIYLVGQSLGSGIASELANLYSAYIEGLILITPYTRFMDVVNSFVPGISSLLTGHDYNTVDHARAFALGHVHTQKGKVLLIGAEFDQLIPFSHAEEISRQTGALLVRFPGGHNDAYDHLDSWKKEFVEFFF